MSIVVFDLVDLKAYGIERKDVEEITDRLGMSLEAMDEKSATIDITPNRPDMLDIVGFSRAASFLTTKRVPKEKNYVVKNEPILKMSVTNSVKRIRPYVAAVVIKNVDLGGNRLRYLINFTEKFCETYGRKRKKIALGIHNFDAINGNLTYDASKDGRFVPLGSKTAESFRKVAEEHEKGIEYSEILGKSGLYPYIKDSKNVISLIPILNSENTRVTNETKNILIEMTGTSERSIEDAINMMACSFIDSGADVYPCEIIYPNKRVVTPHLEYEIIKIRKSKAEITLGIRLEDNKMITLANRLGHYAAKYGSNTMFYVAPYRLDILNEQDLIEDIAIAYGYNNIEPIPVVGVSSGLPEESKEQANRISRLMIGMGYTEAMNPYLTNENLNFGKMERKGDPESTIQIAYAKTETITMLRTDLLPWLVQNLSGSTNDRMPQRLFEIGSVFRLSKGNPVEGTNICMVNEHSKANFSEMKMAVRELLKLVNCNNYQFKEFKDNAFIDGRAAQIIVGSSTIGYFGEIHPKVLQNFKIEEPVVAAEINLNRFI